MKNVLLYTTDTEKKKAILRLCRKLGLSVKILGNGDFQSSVGNLAGMEHRLLPGGPADVPNQRTEGLLTKASPPAMPDVIVFAGMKEECLDNFLKEYNGAGIAPTPLKAIVTPYNVGWSLSGLIAELIKEHKELAGPSV